jgi:hypothetical protein
MPEEPNNNTSSDGTGRPPPPPEPAGEPEVFELDAPPPLMRSAALDSGPVPVSGPAAMEALAAQAEAHAKAQAARAKAEGHADESQIAGDGDAEGGEGSEIPGPATPLSRHGFPGVRVLTIIGVVVMLAGAVINAGASYGLPGESSFWMIVGRALLILFLAVIHTGTGIGALVIAAFFLQRKAAASPKTQGGVSGWELGAARMFVAVSVFLLVSSVALPALGWFGVVLMTLAGAGAYWGAIWALFRLPARETTTLMLCHAALYALLSLGTALSTRLEQGRLPANMRGAPASSL